MKNQQGLSLIEVMVAIIILAIGVIAAAGLQGTALQNTSKAERIQKATKVAESELDYLRQINLSGNHDGTCETNSPDGYDCAVTILPCDVVSGAFSCSEDTSVIKAYQVTISVNGPTDENITLNTYVTESKYRNALDHSSSN